MTGTADGNRYEVDPRLTARIVESYVRHHAVGTGQVSELITSIHGALAQLERPNQPEELHPAVSIRQSVRQDYVVCLDCGYRAKALRRHITTQHSLSPDEYLKRWRLRKDHPLTAPAYSEQRSTMAKARGFGRKATPKPAPAAAAPIVSASGNAGQRSAEKPARKRANGSASKSDVVSQAAAAPPLVRKRGSRVAPRG